MAVFVRLFSTMHLERRLSPAPHSRGFPANGGHWGGAALLAALVSGVGAGCSLAPRATEAERERAEAAGVSFATPFESRTLPPLPDTPGWREVLERAFLANGDLEAAYFRWQAAIARIDPMAAWPNSNVMLGYSYMFSGENMKAFDRMTFTAGFDTMDNLTLPVKARQAGWVALDEARATGERFRAAKFELQRRVLTAWARYGLVSELTEIRRKDTDLLRYLADTSVARVRTGEPASEVSRAFVALRESENQLKNLDADRSAMRAMLNGMLSREPEAPLAVPAGVEIRELRADDATLLAAAVDQNPELTALAREVEGRSDALELARLAWVPDINPSFMFTGSISQAIGAAVVFPTNVIRIRGRIQEARAALAESQAMVRQTTRDRAGAFVATLIALRNAERQVRLYEDEIIPLAETTIGSLRAQYAAKEANLVEYIDAQRALLEARLARAEARAAREERLAELEALAGMDVESLGGANGSIPDDGP